jgi:hypothetical protein
MQRIDVSPLASVGAEASVFFLLLSTLTSNATLHDRHDFQIFSQIYFADRKDAGEALPRERKVHSMHRREL